MKRADDFQQRRQHIANLTDEELYARFWELTDQVVNPLLELGRKNTTPSVERSVLLRMGISSLETQKIVNHCICLLYTSDQQNFIFQHGIRFFS